MTTDTLSRPPLCAYIATGGTIAMKVDPDTGAAIPTLSGEDLLKTVPGMADTARLEVDHPFNIPSDCMGPVRWVALRESVAAALARDDVTGVIVAHGTDTLEETAWFLDLTIDSPKPVVMIGAQCNASSPDFDGPHNLLNAARVCILPDARNKGGCRRRRIPTTFSVSLTDRECP